MVASVIQKVVGWIPAWASGCEPGECMQVCPHQQLTIISEWRMKNGARLTLLSNYTHLMSRQRLPSKSVKRDSL